MIYVIKVIGIIMLVIGVAFFIKPELARKAMDFIKVGKRIYVGAAVRIIIGALLLLSIKASVAPLIPGIIGGVVLLSGIILAIMGPQKTLPIIESWQQKPDSSLRIPATLVTMLGILLIFSA